MDQVSIMAMMDSSLSVSFGVCNVSTGPDVDCCPDIKSIHLVPKPPLGMSAFGYFGFHLDDRFSHLKRCFTIIMLYRYFFALG